MKSPKSKGDAYEREVASWLNENVYGSEQCYRAPLSGGGRSFAHGVDKDVKGGSADLLGTTGIWVEAKRTEKFQPYAAMEQAERGIGSRKTDEIAVVISRRNRMSTDESLVVMRAGDWAKLYAAWIGRQKA